MAKYGYKPKAISTAGMTVEQLQAARKSTRVSLRRIAWGRRKGEVVMGDGSPVAGVTAGATTTAEAIEMIRAVNPALATNCERFAAGASTAKGAKRVRYHVDGVEADMPTAAAERGVAAGTMTIVGTA